jgi:hypothetical protein
VEEGLKKNKQRPIFLEGVRAFYDLEGLWVDAPEVRLEPEGIRKAEGESVKG